MVDRLHPDVAIVGGGPAGLGCAIELRRLGVSDILVLEREVEAGGIPRHCGHPLFGLREFGRILTGPAYARRLRERALQVGVDIRPGHSVTAIDQNGVLCATSSRQALTIAAQRVILATGARETPRAARLVTGERPLGIINTGALQACLYLKQLKPFARPVIVGTELVSLSSIWTCRQHAINPVAVLEAGAAAIARWPLRLYPRLAGVPLHLGARITAIRGCTRVERVEIVTATGEPLDIACDGVLFTGQFLPESSLMWQSALELDHSGTGGPLVDQFSRCRRDGSIAKNLFATGNALRPIETAGWCYFEGRRTARSVAQDLAEKLPQGAATIAIERGAGVKLVVPQRLALHGTLSGMEALQVRATHRGRCRLVVRDSQRTLWSKRLSVRPEQRLLIPLRALSIQPAEPTLTVSIEPAH